MDIGTAEIGAMNRQGPQQMPVIEAGEGGGIVVFLQAPGQFGDGIVIEGGEPLRRDRRAGAGGWDVADRGPKGQGSWHQG
jgi:hypothetical protein